MTLTLPGTSDRPDEADPTGPAREAGEAGAPPPRPPRPPKPPRAPRGARPPRPPRRMPQPLRPLRPLSPGALLARGALLMLAALLLTFVLNVSVVAELRHAVSQQQLMDAFREQLKEGTAPVSEGTFEDVLLANGAPVGILEIPALGVREVIVEGTDSATTQLGPGHRRDTSLPGQEGVSVLFGRSSGYGGPFRGIQRLAPGDEFSITTGQGVHTYEVIGLRYAGDPSPPRLMPGQSRVVLTAARGAPFAPAGIARVDAQLTSEVMPAGPRQTRFATLLPQERELAGDASMVWALVFALQFLVLVEAAAVWSHRRMGGRRTWIVFVPLITVAALWVTSEVARLLPNLL